MQRLNDHQGSYDPIEQEGQITNVCKHILSSEQNVSLEKNAKLGNALLGYSCGIYYLLS